MSAATAVAGPRTATAAIMAAEDAGHLAVYPKPPLALVEGQGCWVRDAEGRRYLDLYGGHCVALLGHGHPRLVAAVQHQAARLLFVSNAVYNDARARAVQKLCAIAPPGLARVFLCNTGSEANETALKIARRFTGRRHVVSMREGFHGRTLGALGATGPDKYRHPSWPVPLEHERIPYGDAAALAAALGPHVAAVITEPIPSLGGVRVADASWFVALRQVCDAAGALLIFDEVQTGLGRTGRMWFGEHVGVVPDLITTAKGLAGGVPAAAVFVRQDVAATIGSGEQGTTFGGGPLACAAIEAVLDVLQEEDLAAKAASVGEALAAALRRCPGVLGVPGRGLLLGVDLDRPAAPVADALREEGVLVGTGGPPNQLRLLPPLTLTADEALPFADVLARVLAAPAPAHAVAPRVAASPLALPSPGASLPAAPATPSHRDLGRRHLLSLAALEDGEWRMLLADAEVLAGAAGRRPLLVGARFGALFLDPSLRTRVSFEVACRDLGAHAVVLQPGAGTWRLEHRDGVPMDGEAPEHVREAIPVLGEMLDGLGVRVFAALQDAAEDRAEPILSAIVRASTVPVLNLESAADHPHQGLADALTLRRRFGDRKVKVVLRWAPHRKALPRAVPHAALLAFAREGHEVVLCHPEGFDLDPSVLASARRFAAAAGGSLEISHDRRAASRGAAALYAKSWTGESCYGRAEAAAAALAAHRDWIVTQDDLDGGRALFLHCLPVRRGVVVADAVLDGPCSIVREQAAARLPVQKATLCRALGVRP